MLERHGHERWCCAQPLASGARFFLTVPMMPYLMTVTGSEGGGRLSPDGRWLLYQSDASGRFEIYVQPFPGPGGKWIISTNGGREPVWSPNDKELFYHTGNSLMAVAIETDPEFSSGVPRFLFEWP